MADRDVSSVTGHYHDGIALAVRGAWFEAHESFEAAWRSCEAEERDFFQGLVHVVVSAYQRGRGKPVAAESQRLKALRRLRAFAPRHRGLDVGSDHRGARAFRARPARAPGSRRRAARRRGGRRAAARARRASPLSTPAPRGSGRAPSETRASPARTRSRRARTPLRGPSEYATSRTTPRAIVPVELASTSTDASTVPMHGAAHTANAPPRSAPEPVRRAPCSRPGATVRSGQGSSPTNASPITIEHEAGDLRLGRLRHDARDRGRSGAEQHEHDREAGDERHAAAHDSPRRAGLRERADLERRDRREIAGDERQHARGDDGEQPGEKRDRKLLSHRTARAPRRRAARPPRRGATLSARADFGAFAHARPLPGAAGDCERPDQDPADRQHPRDQVEAVRARDAVDAVAELRGERVLDPALRPAERDVRRG